MTNSFSVLGKKILTGLVAGSVRAAVPLLVLSMGLTGLLLYYVATYLSLNTDTSDMLDPDLPYRRASRQFSAAFPQLMDELVVVIESRHAGDAKDAANRLATLLRGRPEIVQSVYQPGGGDFFDKNGLLYLETDKLWTLDDRLAEAEPFLGTLASDPSLRGLLEVLSKALSANVGKDELPMLIKMFDRISNAIEKQVSGKPQAVLWQDELFEEGEHRGMLQRFFLLVKPKIDYTSLQPAQAALDLIHQLKEPIQGISPDNAVRIRVTGSVAMNNEELVTVSRDAMVTASLSFVLVTLLLIWGLQTAGAVVAVLVTMICGLIWTAAFATYAIGSLNLISVCFAVLFIGMGVDFGIQYAMRYLEACDRCPDKVTALYSAAAGVGGALTLASIGAAISFCAFVPTSYRGLAELGIISGFSMLVALFANLTLLPAMLSLQRKAGWYALPALEVYVADKFNSIVRQYRRIILAVTVLLIIISVGLLPLVRFDFNPLNLKDSATESVATYIDLARDPNSTLYTISALASNLDAARETAARLEKLAVVDKAVTLASYIPEDQGEKLQIIDGMRSSLEPALNPSSQVTPPGLRELTDRVHNFHGNLKKALAGSPATALAISMKRLDSALDALQTSSEWPDRAVSALSKLLIGDLAKTLERLRGLLDAESITLSDLPQDLQQRYIAADGRARIEVFPKENLSDNRTLREFVHGVQSVAPDATDSPVELLEGSEAVIHACLVAATLALLLTMIMHFYVLRSVLEALLIAAPLTLAMLLTGASSVLFNIPFNFANIIALPLLIGLNNAYGAYLVLRSHGAESFYRVMHSSTPRAVLFSGLTAISSFGVLAISKHPGMASMGVLITLSLLYALLSALIVLPALMAQLEARRLPKTRLAGIRRGSKKRDKQCEKC